MHKTQIEFRFSYGKQLEMYEEEEQRKIPDGLFNWQENYYFIEEHFIQFTNCRYCALVILFTNNICLILKPISNHFKSTYDQIFVCFENPSKIVRSILLCQSSDSPEIVMLMFFSNKLRGTYIVNECISGAREVFRNHQKLEGFMDFYHKISQKLGHSDMNNNNRYGNHSEIKQKL